MNQQKENQLTKNVRTNNVQKIKTATTKTCAICKERFHSPTKFSLFCTDCKEHSESYRFADWLSA